MIKKLLVTLTALIALSLPARAEDRTLYLYTWDTYAAPALFKKFEWETGIKVVTDIYSSNDTLIARLKSGAAYDVVVPSGNYVPLLVAEHLLRPLPEGLRTIGRDMTEKVSKPAYDPEYKHVLPLFYGTTAIAVNTKLVKEDITSWAQFFKRPENEKPGIGVLDDIGTVMDVTSIMLDKPYCDHSPDTLRATQELLMAQKPFVKVYGATGYFERLAAGEIALQMAWSGDTYKVRKQNPNIRYIYPKEGVELWADNLAIPANARSPDAAAEFIRFMLRPDNAAAWSEISGMAPSVKAAFALLPQELKDAPEFSIPEGIKAETSIACPPEAARAYNEIWERLIR